MSDLAFFIDYSRCIGCQSCMQACGECDTHRGRPLIHLEIVQRADTVQTVPQVCMHCEDPICARVCPADAIKQTPDGVTQSSLKERCIGCSNCVMACPFGVPHYFADINQMVKCDMCYDRTSTGKKPMCATVCPSQALCFTTMEDIKQKRRGTTIREWAFGGEPVKTKVFVVVPEETRTIHVDQLRRSVSPTSLGARPRDLYDVAELLEA